MLNYWQQEDTKSSLEMCQTYVLSLHIELVWLSHTLDVTNVLQYTQPQLSMGTRTRIIF